MCLRISAIMKMTLRDSEPVVLVNSSCSCVAGSGLCNHLVALLYQTAHYYESGMSVVPPVLSCTQTEQKWHKPRTMGVKPGPVDAMVVVKPKPGATSASGIRSSLYKAYSGELPVPSTLDPKAVYADLKPGSLPLICTMNLSPDKPLMDSIFGKVQAGSILSYQHPPPTPDGFITHKDAPPFPKVPPEGYLLKPTDCTYVPTNQEQLHLHSLSVTLLQSHLIEESTRCQSAAPEWHSLRKERVTASNFREVSHVRGPNSAENLAETLKNLNLRKCGLVIHPDAPWLGASPDGLVYDPLERPSFGLVEMKCPNALNYVDCRYLRVDHGTYKLKESHAYYWQVQGQLLMTGMEWCDFVVCAHDDVCAAHLQRQFCVKLPETEV